MTPLLAEQLKGLSIINLDFDTTGEVPEPAPRDPGADDHARRGGLSLRGARKVTIKLTQYPNTKRTFKEQQRSSEQHAFAGPALPVVPASQDVHHCLLVAAVPQFKTTTKARCPRS
jgi:hypothetical protein